MRSYLFNKSIVFFLVHAHLVYMCGQHPVNSEICDAYQALVDGFGNPANFCGNLASLPNLFEHSTNTDHGNLPEVENKVYRRVYTREEIQDLYAPNGTATQSRTNPESEHVLTLPSLVRSPEQLQYPVYIQRVQPDAMHKYPEFPTNMNPVVNKCQSPDKLKIYLQECKLKYSGHGYFVIFTERAVADYLKLIDPSNAGSSVRYFLIGQGYALTPLNNLYMLVNGRTEKSEGHFPFPMPFQYIIGEGKLFETKNPDEVKRVLQDFPKSSFAD